LHNKKELPNIVKKRYKTPFGTYMPDFEFDNRFIEIKSEFTLNVAKGKEKMSNGKYSDNQWKKIMWLSKNKKFVDVIIIDKDDAKKYFKDAKNNGLILN
jgi:hypothetical protein